MKRHITQSGVNIRIPDSSNLNAVADSINTYFSASEQVLANGEIASGSGNRFYADINDVIHLSSNIEDADGNIQTYIDQASLNYPETLIMPVVKIAGGHNGVVVDEVAFKTTFINGAMTSTGKLPEAGVWYIHTERMNAALASIGADWKIDRPNIIIGVTAA